MKGITVSLPVQIGIGLGIEYFGMVPVEPQVQLDSIRVYPVSENGESGRVTHSNRIVVDPNDQNYVAVVKAIHKVRDRKDLNFGHVIKVALPNPIGYSTGEKIMFVVVREVSFTTRVCHDIKNRDGVSGKHADETVRMAMRPRSKCANWHAIVDALAKTLPQGNKTDKGEAGYASL